MSDHSRIEWTDATWNVILGCDRVSPGCLSCYAITTARIRESNPNPKIAGPYAGLVERRNDRIDWTGRVNLVTQRLDLPLRWQKPKRIFVNAQSDLWHAAVDDDFLAQVFAVMAIARRHTFQILTKRPGRMRTLLNLGDFRWKVWHALLELAHRHGLPVPWGSPEALPWPLLNVWLGVSAEDARWAKIRISLLQQTPAAVRFVSAEPLLGAITLCRCEDPPPGRPDHLACPLHGAVRLDWVIVGGESGREARPMHPDWARHLRDQCAGSGVPFVFKQWGEWAPGQGTASDRWVRPDPAAGVGIPMARVGKRAAGRVLDGRTWDEYPQDRVATAAQRREP